MIKGNNKFKSKKSHLFTKRQFVILFIPLLSICHVYCQMQTPALLISHLAGDFYVLYHPWHAKAQTRAWRTVCIWLRPMALSCLIRPGTAPNFNLCWTALRSNMAGMWCSGSQHIFMVIGLLVLNTTDERELKLLQPFKRMNSVKKMAIKELNI